MSSTIKRSLGRGLLVSAVAVALVGAGSGAAWAWWTATASVSGTVTTTNGTTITPPPVGLSCTSNTSGLQVSWAAADATQNPVPPGATVSYVVTLFAENGGFKAFPAIAAPASLSQQITYRDLPNSGGETLTVTVKTVYTISGQATESVAAGPLAGVTNKGTTRIVQCGA